MRNKKWNSPFTPLEGIEVFETDKHELFSANEDDINNFNDDITNDFNTICDSFEEYIDHLQDEYDLCHCHSEAESKAYEAKEEDTRDYYQEQQDARWE